jgi:hypothetical protein
MNIYNEHGRKYLKCFIRYWELYVEVNGNGVRYISEQREESNSNEKYIKESSISSE